MVCAGPVSYTHLDVYKRQTVYNVWKESMIMARELVFTSEKKTVYRDGSTAIKEFCDGFPKAEVLNEALCNARVEEMCIRDRAVSLEDGDGRFFL